MNIFLNKERWLILGIILTWQSHLVVFAQARLVLNGAKININNACYLTISNSASNAITRLSGAILSDGQNNNVKWNIGTVAATYIVPFEYSGGYIPLSFTTSSAVGTGYFNFSTYRTVSQNSLALPTGVSNFNGASGADKSLFAVDRFWKIDAQGYTTKPVLTNLTFTYLASGFAAPNITSLEGSISAQRYNSGSNTWNDFAQAATVNTTNKTVIVASIAPSNLYPWWVLDYVEDRHWVGASNGNWNNVANWSLTNGGISGGSIPSTYDAAIFNSTFNTNATIDINPTIGSFNMNSGYTGTVSQGSSTLILSKAVNLSGGTFLGGSGPITISGPFTLTGTNFTSTSGILDLKDNFTFNNGVFLHNNGIVKFSGTTSTQQIIGSKVTNFKNINVTNVAANPGLQIQNNENLIGTLSVATNAIVDADGLSNSSVFTLVSTADNPVSDGQIAILPAGAQVTGNVTVQRFMTLEGRNNRRIYRYISSPVQNATVSDIQNEIPITGPFTGSSTCFGCGTNPSTYIYDETILTDINGDAVANYNDGYKGFPTISNSQAFQVGKGYAMLVRGNVIGSSLWDVTGNINSANSSSITLPVTYTSSGNILNDGWNLVGNPFPSTIDWNSGGGWTKTNLDGAIYVTDNGSGPAIIHTSWNGTVGTNGGSRYIALGQGFWVKANGSGIPLLQVNENIKAPNQSSVFFREEPPTDLLKITLSDAVSNDEAIIHFREDASSGFDSKIDAWKFKNSIFNLSTFINDSIKLSINSLSSLACNTKIKFAIDDIAPGNYNLRFNNLNSFNSNPSFILHDSLTNKAIYLEENFSYSFDVTSDPKSFGSRRFSIEVNKQAEPVEIIETSGVLSINYFKNIQWYFNNEIILGATLSTFKPLRSGTYIAKVKTEECILSGFKEVNVLETEPSINVNFGVFPNPSTGKFILTAPEKYKILSLTIFNAQGNFLQTREISNYNGNYKDEIDLSRYAPGIYILKILHQQGINFFKLIKN